MQTKFNLGKKFLGMLSIGIITSASVFATVTGTDVMQKAYDVKKPNFTHSAVEMDLISSNGDVQKRLVEEWSREKNDLASTVMIFRSPSSVKDTRFLQIENESGPNSKWIYLPALRTVRRVSSAEGDKSFMGTDATYDDMETRKVDVDNHELLGSESFNGYDCYKVKSTAKDLSSSQYAYRISWVDKNSYVPVKIEMYDKQNALEKVLTVDKLQQVQGYWIPLIDTMKNVQSGHSTKIGILKLELDKAVSDGMFTSAFLKTGRI
ncbi:MAG: outer membrane lipoprotein-sorting protein [Spirochaetia bacterium]|nr:outer membrane lipoprotein-sorting protein [Spirochaetia bacterium]